jgi:DedD protein
MSEQNDTEIILGTGKLLGIFFVLVIICGTFFGLGYALGRNSGPMALQNGTASAANSSGAKPGAGVTVSAPRVVATSSPEANAGSQADQASAVQPSANDEAASTNTQPVPSVVPATATTKSPTPTESEPASNGSITVQVAAVTKQEDADVLVAALRRKNYPVFVAPGTSVDSLYHVQVGPFAELKDAEAIKSKLAGDGYNAIVKK